MTKGSRGAKTLGRGWPSHRPEVGRHAKGLGRGWNRRSLSPSDGGRTHRRVRRRDGGDQLHPRRNLQSSCDWSHRLITVRGHAGRMIRRLVLHDTHSPTRRLTGTTTREHSENKTREGFFFTQLFVWKKSLRKRAEMVSHSSTVNTGKNGSRIMSKKLEFLFLYKIAQFYCHRNVNDKSDQASKVRFKFPLSFIDFKFKNSLPFEQF